MAIVFKTTGPLSALFLVCLRFFSRLLDFQARLVHADRDGGTTSDLPNGKPVGPRPRPPPESDESSDPAVESKLIEIQHDAMVGPGGKWYLPVVGHLPSGPFIDAHSKYLYRDPSTNLQYMRRQDWERFDETNLLSTAYVQRFNFTGNWRTLSRYEADRWTTFSKRAFQHIYSTGKWGFGRERDEFDVLYGHEWEWNEIEQNWRRKNQFYARHNTAHSDPLRRMGTAGSGSIVEHTEGLRRQLRKISAELNVNKIFDFACGDMLWASKFVEEHQGKELDLQKTGSTGTPPPQQERRSSFYYIGMEIAPAEAARHRRRFRANSYIHVINGDFTNFRFFRNFTEIAEAIDAGKMLATAPATAASRGDKGRPSAPSRSLLFIRDALQHVSLEQSCRFFLNVYLWRKELLYAFRWLLIGGYDTGAKPNQRDVPTPGATENNPRQWPFRLESGFVKMLPEEDNPEGLKEKGFHDENVRKRIAAKQLFLYDVEKWLQEDAFDPCEI
eukprot:g13997.t1